jgi:hypothetical protein
MKMVNSKKYKKTRKRYKKVCDINDCVMSAINGKYCCNYITYNNCKIINPLELIFTEKKANIIFNKN